MKQERHCDDCGYKTDFRRTRCVACNKMVCRTCWAFGPLVGNCPYPDERKRTKYGKPHRANIKLK